MKIYSNKSGVMRLVDQSFGAPTKGDLERMIRQSTGLSFEAEMCIITHKPFHADILPEYDFLINVIEFENRDPYQNIKINKQALKGASLSDDLDTLIKHNKMLDVVDVRLENYLPYTNHENTQTIQNLLGLCQPVEYRFNTHKPIEFLDPDDFMQSDVFAFALKYATREMILNDYIHDILTQIRKVLHETINSNT